jgi:hypothetical protein
MRGKNRPYQKRHIQIALTMQTVVPGSLSRVQPCFVKGLLVFGAANCARGINLSVDSDLD